MTIKTKLFLLTALFLMQQGCDRPRQLTAEKHASSSQCHADLPTLFINEKERYALQGNIDHLVIRYQVNQASQWIDQCSCLVERISDADHIIASGHDFHQVRSIYHYDCRVGEASYHAATFYHAASGLLIHQMRCDQPGLLSARATLQGGKAIARTEIRTSNEAINAGVLFIPFEAEVATDGDSLIIRGEGELILVMAIKTGNKPQKSVAEKWRDACIKYAPSENEHYDVIKVANALLSECESASLNP